MKAFRDINCGYFSGSGRETHPSWWHRRLRIQQSSWMETRVLLQRYGQSLIPKDDQKDFLYYFRKLLFDSVGKKWKCWQEAARLSRQTRVQSCALLRVKSLFELDRSKGVGADNRRILWLFGAPKTPDTALQPDYRGVPGPKCLR